MRGPVRLLAVAALLTSAACASTRTAPSPAPAPDIAEWPGSSAPFRGRLYAACVGQAITAGRYDRVDDHDGHLLRFRCAGAPARALFEEMGPWSVARHSEWRADGRLWRSTNRVVHNLFGVDYCSSDGAEATCALSLNVGDFLATNPTGAGAR